MFFPHKCGCACPSAVVGLPHTPTNMNHDNNPFDDEEDFEHEFSGYLDDDNDVWKSGPLYETWQLACKRWESVMNLLEAALEGPATAATSPEDVHSLPPAEFDPDKTPGPEDARDFLSHHAGMILSEAMLAQVKLQSSGHCLYIIRMENASEIRAKARMIFSSLLLFAAEDMVSRAYVDAVRREITQFRLAFRDWVKEFRKDEFEDEWGLYV